MKPQPVIAAAALMLLAFATPGRVARAQPELPTVAAQVALGHGLVVRNCGMCHAVGERGESPNPQAPPFRRLHQRMDVEMLGEGLATGILTGHPDMPEFRFSPHEVVAIIRYLRAVQDRQAS